MHTARRLLLSSFVVALVVLPSATVGQTPGVHYTSTSRVEFAGAIGTMMGAFGGGDPTESETWMQGGTIRTDDGATSTVTNLLEGWYLMIDHDTRSYFRTTFADMMAFADSATAAAAGQMPATQPSAAGDAEDPGVEAEFSFDADRTGERKSIGGYEAERVILTMNVEFSAEDEEGAMQEAGDMVMVTELWITDSFPSADAELAEAFADLDEEWLEGMNERGTGAMDQIMATNPQLGTAMQRMQEEMDGLDGTTLESTAYVVLLAPGNELDRDAVFALSGQPLSEGLGSVAGRAAGSAAQDAAVDAARSAAGRLGGLFGRKKSEPEEPAEPEMPTQSVMARITTMVTSIEAGPFDAQVFQVDPSYTERPAPWAGGGATP